MSVCRAGIGTAYHSVDPDTGTSLCGLTFPFTAGTARRWITYRRAAVTCATCHRVRYPPRRKKRRRGKWTRRYDVAALKPRIRGYLGDVCRLPPQIPVHRVKPRAREQLLMRRMIKLVERAAATWYEVNPQWRAKYDEWMAGGSLVPRARSG